MSSAYTHTSSTHWTDFLITLLCGFQGDRQGATQLEDRIQLLGSMGWPLGAQQAAGVTSGSHPGLDLSAQSCRRALRLPILGPSLGSPEQSRLAREQFPLPASFTAQSGARGDACHLPEGLSWEEFPGPHQPQGPSHRASACPAPTLAHMWVGMPRPAHGGAPQGKVPTNVSPPPHQLCLGDLPQLEP